MLCDFNSVFNPSLEQRMKRNICLYQIAKETIKQHSCTACKYANIEEANELSCVRQEIYCSLDGQLKVDTIKENCNKWELSEDYKSEYKMLCKLVLETITDSDKAELLIDILENKK